MTHLVSSRRNLLSKVLLPCLVALLLALGMATPGANSTGRRPVGPNPYLAFLPAEAAPDYAQWQAYLRQQGALKRAQRPRVVPRLLASESEPNDDLGSANAVVGLGTGDGTDDEADVSGDLVPGDVDFFSVDLRAGDVVSGNVFGSGFELRLFDPAGTQRIGSTQDATFIIPGPLPGGGNAAFGYVVEADGTYGIRVSGGTGPYTLELRLFRPPLESAEDSTHQILFIDFDGATFDASVLGGPSLVTLSPLSSFLSGWGLSPGDEDAVIDAILAATEENLSADMRVLGLNGDFDTTGRRGDFDIEILNSRDHPDPFGGPNVSRVIVGGTIGELGISTIGIAQSIDIGNFDAAETAVVLLDLLSASASDPNSLNQYSLGGGATVFDLIGIGVGNIVAHEAGHFFADFHTDRFNASPNIMDQGGNLDNLVGVGPDRIFGTADDLDVDFGPDIYALNEGFSGIEDTLNAVAFGLPTNLAPPLDHFMFYSVRENPAGPFDMLGAITLKDQFDERRWLVVRPTELGVPANKNDEGIADPLTHLTSYRLRPLEGLSSFDRVSDIRILNQCNDLFLEVKKPERLLVPTNKKLSGPAPAVNPEGNNRDHFLCYKAGVVSRLSDGRPAPDFPKGIQVEVSDQFQSRRYDLTRITRLCSPVAKSGEPFYLEGPNQGTPFPLEPAEIRNPTRHLVCYRAKRAKKLILQDGCGPATPLLTGKVEPTQPRHDQRRGVHLHNQLGEQVIDTKREVELCIPSWTNPVCGDGDVQTQLGEECDDGNTDDGDGCSGRCVVEFCGDQTTQPGIGEECDGTDDAACPGFCSTTCSCIDPCPHGVCETGGPLDPSCGSCEATVCAVDSFCCNFGWDSACVSLANTLCGNICNPPYGSPTRAFLHPMEGSLLD